MSFEIKLYNRILLYLHDRLRTVKNLDKYAYQGTLYASERFANYFKKTYLSGHPIKAKTGRLRSSVKPVIRVHGRSILGGISWGGPHIPYALVHINDRVGIETHISPVRRKYLTVPVGANKEKDIFKKATDMPFSIVKFPYIGMYSNRQFVPYFILKKHVVLKSKVGVDEVMAYYKPIFMKDVMSIVKEKMKSTRKKR